MIISFTGHRPNKLNLGIVRDYKQFLIEYLCDTKPEKVVVGMALGIDMHSAEVCYDLGIPFVAAVPFKGQEENWGAAQIKKYRWLLERAERVVIISDGGYAPWKYDKRNKWMVDNSDELIAAYNGDQTGGTYNTIQYALVKNKPIKYYLIPKIYA